MKINSFLFLFLLSSLGAVWSQTFLDSKNLSSPSLKIPEENIYIQTDKDVYKPSEIIWFKAYILNTITNIPSHINQTLFIHLRKAEDTTIVYQKKFEIIDGFSNGDLFLKEDLEEGEYILMANTASSINNDDFPIINYKTIMVKSNSSEKVLMDYLFDKKSYALDEKVKITLNFYTNKGVDVRNENIKISYFIASKKMTSESVITDDNGTLNLKIDNEYVAKDNEVTFELKYKKVKQFFAIKIPLQSDSNIKFDVFPEGGNLVYNVINKVAFKATDLKGIPIKFKAALFENGKAIIPLKPLHDGMGYFNFKPHPNNTYVIKVKTPEKKIILLPKIQNSGYALQVVKNNSEGLFVNVSQQNMATIQNLYLRLKYKGIVQWLGNITAKKDTNLFKIPREFLPEGVCELTLLNSDLAPIAERLIFTGIDEELKITNFIGLEDLYKNKDKITLKFKVTDKFNNPSNANLGLRVYDNAYLDPNINTNIEAHYHLFSNLRGPIYKPSQYFDSSDDKRLLQLDLVMLTHGWRNYVYDINYLNSRTTFSNKTLNDQVILNVKEINKEKALQTPKEPFDVTLIYQDKFLEKTVNYNGMLHVPLVTEPFVYVKLPETKNYYYKQPSEFNSLEAFLKRKDLKNKTIFEFQNNDIDREFLKNYYLKNGNILNEVVVKASKDRSAYKGNNDDRRFLLSGKGDYVCSQYNIFNCVNHQIGGYRPIDGSVYRTNSGDFITYKTEKNISGTTEFEEATKGFQYIQGYTYKKVFFKPDYDIDPKEFYDNRTTLAWEPNLTTNDEGFAEISFFTSDVNSSFTIHVEGVDLNGNIGSETYNIRVR